MLENQTCRDEERKEEKRKKESLFASLTGGKARCNHSVTDGGHDCNQNTKKSVHSVGTRIK